MEGQGRWYTDRKDAGWGEEKRTRPAVIFVVVEQGAVRQTRAMQESKHDSKQQDTTITYVRSSQRKSKPISYHPNVVVTFATTSERMREGNTGVCKEHGRFLDLLTLWSGGAQ